MSSQPLIALPSIGETFGACYIGSLIATILYGISNLQVALYYKRYPNDWWVYQYSIAILWALDALHVAFSTHALYYYMIKMFGNFNGLDCILWSMKLQWCLIVSLHACQRLPLDPAPTRSFLSCRLLGYMLFEHGNLLNIFTRFYLGLFFWLWSPQLVPPYTQRMKFTSSQIFWLLSSSQYMKSLF
ncbi:hypothetical protein EDD85DRAFT_944985 [Armillaria nabsnona]|nr:hypothetical protein EDD85DRAFT_944985 [Armillaria nabsnona]